MEAKEIVAQEVARQAEFGMEPSWEDFVIAGQETRIKEVAEYVNGFVIKTNNTIVIDGSIWRAKLKDWGIKE